MAGALILAAMLVFMSAPISAQDAQPATDPAAVISAVYDAINAGDVESAIAYYDMVQNASQAPLQLNEEFLYSRHTRAVGPRVEPTQSD